MSGGLDSSVTAVLCKRAQPDNILGLILPCYSKDEDSIDALSVAKKFNIVTQRITLDPVFDSLVKTIPDKGESSAVKIAKANLKSRLRMSTLYYCSNQLKYLVVGTSNKSEITIGYFTKYGDGAADILPLGNLYKTEVRQLAEYLDIPENIVKKPPSAGLWPGQTEYEELGFRWSDVDNYLIMDTCNESLQGKINDRIEANAHKRQPAPIPPFSFNR
ncbi:MAG: NAD(+) synthase [Chloroflexi bacterium]|nr:NAD(+) synthase [Chloroflexota bacterium]